MRDSINLTISEPLRRAHIRPRLEVLAASTGLAQTHIAGRALTLGLAIIEGDMRRLFTGAAANTPTAGSPSASAPSTTQPTSPEPSAAPPSTTGHREAQQGEVARRADEQHSAATSKPAQEPEPLPEVKHEPTPQRPASPALLTTEAAARALGYREPSAFKQHVHRHPEIRKLARKDGRSLLWDLGKLRAAYDRNGWQPK